METEKTRAADAMDRLALFKYYGARGRAFYLVDRHPKTYAGVATLGWVDVLSWTDDDVKPLKWEVPVAHLSRALDFDRAVLHEMSSKQRLSVAQFFQKIRATLMQRNFISV